MLVDMSRTTFFSIIILSIPHHHLYICIIFIPYDLLSFSSYCNMFTFALIIGVRLLRKSLRSSEVGMSLCVYAGCDLLHVQQKIIPWFEVLDWNTLNRSCFRFPQADRILENLKLACANTNSPIITVGLGQFHPWWAGAARWGTDQKRNEVPLRRLLPTPRWMIIINFLHWLGRANPTATPASVSRRIGGFPCAESWTCERCPSCKKGGCFLDYHRTPPINDVKDL